MQKPNLATHSINSGLILRKVEGSKIPHQPGVYIFKAQNKPLYIGKAADLRNRLNSYFTKKRGDPKIELLIQSAKKIEWQITNSEIEALILESQLIKKFDPKFNIKLRDDKRYFYVAVTKENFPKIY